MSPLAREEEDDKFFAEFGHLVSKRRAQKEGETSEEDRLSTGSYDSKGPKELREVTTLHNKAQYEGEWIGNYREGHGTQTWPDG